MAGFSIVRKRKAELPKKFFDQKTLDLVGKVAQGAILDNIVKQRTTTGGRIKVNSSSTRARKQRAGRPVLSLVDKQHRFVKGAGGSWAFTKTHDSVIIKPASGVLAALSRYAQQKGYTDWFGIGRTARAVIRKLFRKAIKDAFRKKRNA